MEKSCLNCEFGKPEKVKGKYYCSGEEGSRAQGVMGHENTYGEDWWSDKYLPDGCGSYYKPRKETPTKMDKQTAIINHRHMWGWLSENPEKNKEDYLKIFWPDRDLAFSCFLCQYDLDQDADYCGKTCILVWPGDVGCGEKQTPFSLWCSESSITLRTELARQIRDLPERGKVPGMATYKHPGTIRRRYEVDLTTMENTAAGVKMEVKSPPPKLTRSEAIAETRKQWRWYANNPDESKIAYFVKNHIANIPFNECYLCKLVRTDEKGYLNRSLLATPNGCGKGCPLQWPGGCCSLGAQFPGLYELWLLNTGDYNLRKSVAWLISRLPEKEV